MAIQLGLLQALCIYFNKIVAYLNCKLPYLIMCRKLDVGQKGYIFFLAMLVLYAHPVFFFIRRH